MQQTKFIAPKADYWQEAAAALSARDAALAEIIAAHPSGQLEGRGDPFFTLARAIIGQQVSVKAADTMWQRFETALSQRIHHEAVLALDEEGMRACGLSRQKISYLKGLAEHFSTQGLDRLHWHEMTDDEVTRRLVAITGIGSWTAEMFLIFCLCRPDVFPIKDIGVQKAIEKHYGKGKTLTLERMQRITKSWKPWRTVATWYLWRSLDPVPVAY